MSQANPILSAARLQTPTIDASPSRYGFDDTLNPNRRVSLLSKVIPQVQIQGGTLQVRGHFPGPPVGRDAEYYANFGSPPTQREVVPIAAQTPYEIAAIDGQEMEGPSRTVRLRQLTALANIRDYAQDNYAEFYPELEFQRDAIRRILAVGWELTVAASDLSRTPIEPIDGPFNGLPGLARSPGAGQSYAMSGGGSLLDELDLTIQRVFSNNGRCDALVMNEAGIRAVAAALRGVGIRPDFRYNEHLGQVGLFFDGIPVVRSDFVPNVAGDGITLSSIFAMTLGGPDGVYAITSKDAPGVQFREVRTAEPPYKALQGVFYCALVSPSSDALIELRSIPVPDPIFGVGAPSMDM